MGLLSASLNQMKEIRKVSFWLKTGVYTYSVVNSSVVIYLHGVILMKVAFKNTVNTEGVFIKIHGNCIFCGFLFFFSSFRFSKPLAQTSWSLHLKVITHVSLHTGRPDQESHTLWWEILYVVCVGRKFLIISLWTDKSISHLRGLY